MSRSMPVLLAVLVMAAACEQPDPTTPMEPSAVEFAKGPVMESVTGSGHYTTGDQLRTFSFTARRYADGSVSGEWQQNNRDLEAKYHGDITCFAIEGNQAWLGGVVETGDPQGEVAWTVVDNGQGAAAVPDQISLKFVGGGAGFADSYCAATPQLGEPLGLELNPIEAGNIQIRP